MMICCAKRRQGCITVSRWLALEQPSKLGKMFRAVRFTPLDIEVRLMDGSIKYYGFSPLFEKIDRGAVTPCYRIMATVTEGNPTKFTIEKETY